MNTRAKHISLVILTQTGCLAAGLWMHHRFAVSAIVRGAEYQAWADLVEGAPDFSELDRALRHRERLSDAIGALSTFSNRFEPQLGAVTVVDEQWRPVATTWDGLDGRSPGTSASTALTWTSVDDRFTSSDGFQGGRIRMADGEHLAVVRALPASRGFVLVHEPARIVEERAAALVASQPTIGLLTFVWTLAMLIVAVYLILSRLHDQIDDQRSQRTAGALRQAQTLVQTRDAVIFGLAKLAESRDPETGDHLERISVYATTLANAVRLHPKFRDRVPSTFVRLIGISSALHDIGKVGVADEILRKPGQLTDSERAAMRVHTTIGGRCLRGIERRLGGSNFLQMAREIAFAHHEHWDGMGYPKGLSGEDIPLSARIVAIADVYDALSSRRVYKEAIPHEECVQMIRRMAGTNFDPDLVQIWLTIESKFRTIGGQFERRTDPVIDRKGKRVEDVREAVETEELLPV